MTNLCDIGGLWGGITTLWLNRSRFLTAIRVEVDISRDDRTNQQSLARIRLDQLPVVFGRLTAHEVGGRDGELWPVVDVVPVGGALEKPVQPGLQAVQQLVLENWQVVCKEARIQWD